MMFVDLHKFSFKLKSTIYLAFKFAIKIKHVTSLSQQKKNHYIVDIRWDRYHYQNIRILII